MKIGYLGPKGSFTHSAALAAFPEDQLCPLPSIPASMRHLQDQEVAALLLPIENTIEGTVNPTIDLLFRQASPDSIQVELILPIAQHIMTAPTQQAAWERHEIQDVYSHPQALAQSQVYLFEHYPNARIHEMSSTSAAAEWVQQHPDQPFAAIAPKLSAETYDLVIQQENIQTLKENQTRFWLLGQKPADLKNPSFAHKASLCLTLSNDAPGSLHQALACLSWRQLNMTKIESRPLQTKLGDYFFLIDILLEEHSESLLSAAIAEMAILGIQVKQLGCYPIYLV